MNPFVNARKQEIKTSNTLSIFQEYAWDFEHDCFIYENGKQKVVTGNEAIKVWIYKTLKTERWRYRAYENSYGVELEKFIGTHTNNNESAIDIERYVKEGLLVNPYIISIDEIVTTIENDKLFFKINLTTIYGQIMQAVKI